MQARLWRSVPRVQILRAPATLSLGDSSVYKFWVWMPVSAAALRPGEAFGIVSGERGVLHDGMVSMADVFP